MDTPRIGEVQEDETEWESEWEHEEKHIERKDGEENPPGTGALDVLENQVSRKRSLRKTEERISNGYASVFANKIAKDADAEERWVKRRKLEKGMMSIRSRLEALLQRHEKVFSRDPDGVPPTIDRKLAEHQIRLKPGEKLGLSPPMRKRSQMQEDFLEDMIQRLLRAGLIRKRKEAAAYSSQAHVVTNPGRPMRMTIDYRGLNAKTEPDSFPIPRMDELLFGFRECRFFSTVDAQKGFWHIPVEEESRHLTAFRTRSGVYEWNVLPMGLSNSPASFQRFMSEAFSDMNFVKVYIDDIIIFSRKAEEHLQHLERVLQRCADRGITLKASKCHFLKKKLKILGYYISAEGITQDPEKLESIRNFQNPSDVKSLKRFLGMIQFFRMFSASTARILVPLYALCKKGVKFRWEEAEQKAFEEIKKELLKKRTLAYPDVNEKFYVSVDASDYAYGANLYQLREVEDGSLQLQNILAHSDEWSKAEKDAFLQDNKVPFIVESFSKKWNKHEVNYTTSEKECLAIVNALERWAHYLSPKEFEVWSDHRALTSLTTSEKPRLKRWKLRLTPFNFDLRWKAGRTMRDVDTLSRDERYQSMMVHCVRGYRIDTEAEPHESPDPADPFTNEIELYFVEEHPRLDDQMWEWIFPTGLEGEVPSEEKGEANDASEAVDDEKSRVKKKKKKSQEDSSQRIDEEIRRALIGSHSNFAMSQRNDPKLRQIMDELSNPEGEPQPAYCLQDDGVLYRDGKICVPSHELPLLLWLMHDHPMAGHVGASKLISRIRERFYVPKLNRKVQRYLDHCSCSRSKAKRGKRVGRTITFTHYGPLDCLQVDIVGPFPRSKKGNKYWVTLIDRYTRCLELVPVADRTAKLVAKAIYEHWTTRYGNPLVLMADNEFRSHVIEELCFLSGTRKIHSAPYKPSTNGLCERVHGFVQQLLQNATLNDVREWDTYLPAIRFAIMSSRLDGLGFSPYQLLYGREPRLPADEMIPRDSKVPEDVREYFNRHTKAIRQIRKIFDYTQSKVDARMKWKRDRRENRTATKFQVGDLVYHTRDYYGNSPEEKGLSKLLGRFRGPDPIVKVLGPNTFEVEVGPNKVLTFSARDLCAYRGKVLPEFRDRPSSEALDEQKVESKIRDSLELPRKNPLSGRLRSSSVESKSPELELPASSDENDPFEREDGGESLSPGTGAEEDEKDPLASEHKELNLQEGDVVRDFNGQWILAYETESHKQGKLSLMLGRRSPEGTAIHVHKPRRKDKKVFYLPLYFKKTGFAGEYESKVLDRRPDRKSGWEPWLVELDDKVTTVAKSLMDEDVDRPPERFVRFYAQVWDRKVSESEYPEPRDKGVVVVGARNSRRTGEGLPPRERPPRGGNAPNEIREEKLPPGEPPGRGIASRTRGKRKVSDDPSSVSGNPGHRRSKRLKPLRVSWVDND